MKGKTHLVIGAAIGAAAAAYYPFTFKNAALYITISAFSALSADLDGSSMLSSKLSGVSRLLRELVLWAGILLAAGVIYLYAAQDRLYPEYTIIAVIVFLLGFVAKSGIIRNALVSAIGCGLIYAGWIYKMNWLMGFGLFVAWVPWLNHRGMTHTLWAAALWSAIGWGLEEQLHIKGIATVSAAGYLSHLIADTLTPSGVKWLYPLTKKSFKLPL
ncbi:metal-dependent hydrolase [Paenibacillus sp. sptzw28]|uniref:metal-dependent hydrolase n=1 Tax=Paenibacillus sp. sptzw28 TaxID=715179 RepID=UPI001C6E155A|nr:metal-dependent hydrolase [Paenibacillus sp. sptzw28]QYR19059.1 metal-dependent hydrolase [Paenibacillus sp. sptzw28]